MNDLNATPTNKTRVAFFAALVLFALANAVVYCFHHYYQPPIQTAVLNSNINAASHTREWTWWLARKWLEQRKAPDVVLFGSSQMGSATAACDAQHQFKVVDALLDRHAVTLEDNLQERLGHKVTVFNLAQPGAMCSDTYMASKALFTPETQPRVVIIGIAPRDFIDATMPYAAATEPYKFYSRYISAGKLTLTAYNDVTSWLQMGIDFLPCKRLGTYLQGLAAEGNVEHFDVPADPAHNTALSAVLGAGAAEPGKWLVPANIPQSLWMDNTKEYKHRFQRPNAPVYEAERTFFDAFLNNMQARGITVVVVGMPSLPMNRKLLKPKFWSEFRSCVAHTCALHRAQFLDLTDSPVFIKDDYLDTIHLNARGGAKLFNILANYCAADEAVVAQLNAPARTRIQIATPAKASTIK
ncbi:MAG TPA: hypothetical protein V6D22_11595 [Candidatus Obscuribacterales bacterium]